MLRLYKELAIQAARLAAQSWLAAVSIPIYAFVVLLAYTLSAPIPFVGGFVVGIVASACFGGYLSLLASALDGTKLRMADLKNGLRAVWDVVSVYFVWWAMMFLVGMIASRAGSKGEAIAGVAALASAVLFNVVPELIYQSGSRGLTPFTESMDFITKNPFAWFLPNLVFAFVILWATNALTFSSPGELLVRLAQLGSVGGVLAFIGSTPKWMAALLIVFIHYVMVFRGLLFRELNSGSSRMRAFRRRMEG
jgi:hypothetical protein